ncbi:hypothetical protein [Streptococcus oriscaviae]|uniref:Uncharacterized protein n=1 Tax=Streptococcus oriscaviae TaxID=2781599 RepID=A0ABX7YJZ3_9STRE|nr:hypothetical protein [Streptococcus oriscaviae]QUE53574.1 hypothetical protein INT76_06835 [Streptococcus oriscaviae]
MYNYDNVLQIFEEAIKNGTLTTGNVKIVRKTFPGTNYLAIFDYILDNETISPNDELISIEPLEKILEELKQYQTEKD